MLGWLVLVPWVLCIALLSTLVGYRWTVPGLIVDDVGDVGEPAAAV
jgi:hypothetical protein